MSRLKDLEAQRRVLLKRCDAQRDELAARLVQLTPGALLRGAAGATVPGGVRHPLAWLAAFAGMLLLGRTREVLTFILWVRSAIGLAGRAVQLVRLLSQRRAPRADH